MAQQFVAVKKTGTDAKGLPVFYVPATASCSQEVLP
jgi:hypothetical protein